MSDHTKLVLDFQKSRARHHNHVVGETLCYYCEHIKTNRPGEVKMIIPHYGMNYYLLEVDATGLGYFLKLVSEFNIKDGENENP